MSILRQVPGLGMALGVSTLMTFYGIVSIIVWMLPTEKYGYSMTYKIVVIALILLTMPIALVGGYMVNRRKKKKEEAEKAEKEAKAEKKDDKSESAQKLNKPAGTYEEISQAAEETVQFLKSSNLGSGKDAVYELPWYLVIGGPKSGKTSLSLASGLNFQTLPSQRQSELKFVRPTRNVDWRVTSDAVFLDTAGRYQLEGADQDEWSGLVETIKKYRGNRPLDGMIVSVSVERILHSDEHEIEQMAKVLRSRIDEVIQRTKIRFPIYLVFTHADAIEGFRDSFSNSQKEGKNLVWGATIPLEKSENAHTLFDSEYDLLHTSVMKRRLMRLSAPFPPVRQLKIFNFPLHFGSSRKKIGHFVSNLFRPNPFSENPFLRGFYFTAVPVNRGKVDGGQTMTNVGQTVGLSYFTEKLFRDVILRDKDLVATFQSQKVSPPIMGWLLTFLGAILTFAFLAGSAVSLYKNKVMVENAANHGEAVLTMFKTDKDRNPLSKNPDETRDEIDKIESLRESLVELDKNEREGAPWLMRFGLYSGNRIYYEKLLPIYYNAIEQRYKKPVVKRLEDDLRKFSSSNIVVNPTSLTPEEEETLGKHYDLLKAYLMLSGQYKDQAEATFLATSLAEIWKTEGKVPEGMEIAAQQQLDFYAKQVDRLAKSDTDSSAFPRFNLDDANTKNLVDGVRKKLQAFPAVFRYYKRVTTEISKKVDAVSADSILAGRSSGVIEGSHTVPGAYTVEAYHKFMQPAIENASLELTKDDWVMGEKAEKAQAQGTDIKRLEDKYLNDYTDHWRKFIRGISVPQYKTKDQAVDSLKALANTESPMRITLMEVARQTNLSAEPPSTGWYDYITNLFAKKKNKTLTDDTIVEKEFRPLFAFAGNKEDKPDQAPISLYGLDLKKISDELELADADKVKEIAQDFASQNTKSKFITIFNNAEKGVNTKTEGLKTTAGKEIADLLKRPINNLKSFFGGDIQTQFSKMWAEQILPAAKKAEKGYPFDNENEADLTELTKYLAPGTGTLSKFYTERLQKYFEESNGQLKVKETSEVKFNDDFVKYLNSAFKLREALFGKNPTPSFSYEFKLQKINDALIEVTIDGQKIDSNGTGSTNFKFPASTGETGAFMNFASTAGTTSTSSAPTSSANSSPGNVTNSSKPADTSSGSAKLAFQGAWGLFKFVEAGSGGSPKKGASGEYVLTYKLDGKTVTATIKPSGGDLFDRTIFTSSRAPQNLLK